MCVLDDESKALSTMPSTQSVFHQGSLHYNSAFRCYQYLLTSFAGLPSTAGQMEYNCFILFIYPLIIDWVYTDAKSLQSCPTLCDPMNFATPPGSSVHEILQARMLEWVAIPSSRGASWPRDWTHISYVSCIGRLVLYHYCHLGSPITAPLTGLSVSNIWKKKGTMCPYRSK